MQFLTGNWDADKLILLNLSLNDLSNACQVNIYAANLCNNDDFWRAKILKDFVSLSDVLEYKLPTISMKEYYEKLHSFRIIDETMTHQMYNHFTNNEPYPDYKVKQPNIDYANLSENLVSGDDIYKVIRMISTMGLELNDQQAKTLKYTLIQILDQDQKDAMKEILGENGDDWINP